MAPSDIFFYTGAIFFIFVKKLQKMKRDYVHCPMGKFWRTSLRPFGQNNVGGKTWVKFCLPALRFLKFLSPKDKNSLIFLFSHYFLVDLKKKLKRGRKQCPNFCLPCAYMWYICYCHCIAGHSWDLSEN